MLYLSGFLLIKSIETTTKQIEITNVIEGISDKIIKAKIVANIGFKNAKDIPFETSKTCFRLRHF